MTNPTPEELKLVAEYMGHHHLSQHEGKVLIDVLDPLAGWGAEPDYMEYNPLTNAEQSIELLRMLLDEGYFIDREEQIIYGLGRPQYMYVVCGCGLTTRHESLELAIFNAALAHITVTQGEG